MKNSYFSCRRFPATARAKGVTNDNTLNVPDQLKLIFFNGLLITSPRKGSGYDVTGGVYFMSFTKPPYDIVNFCRDQKLTRAIILKPYPSQLGNRTQLEGNQILPCRLTLCYEDPDSNRLRTNSFSKANNSAKAFLIHVLRISGLFKDCRGTMAITSSSEVSLGVRLRFQVCVDFFHQESSTVLLLWCPRFLREPWIINLTQPFYTSQIGTRYTYCDRKSGFLLTQTTILQCV